MPGSDKLRVPLKTLYISKLNGMSPLLWVPLIIRFAEVPITLNPNPNNHAVETTPQNKETALQTFSLGYKALKISVQGSRIPD